MAMVFLAGPISGLVVQPLIGTRDKQCIQLAIFTFLD
jgi:hypothetical protein